MKTDTKGLSSDGSRAGFVYGLMAEFNFGGNYAFVTGIDVSYRGGKFKQSITVNDTITNTSSTNKLEYIELPLTLKFKTNEIGMKTYYLQAGVSPGFNIRARADYSTTTQVSGGPSSSTSSTDNNISSAINSFNLSMVISGGVEFSLSGNTAFMVGITFSNGLLDVLEDSNTKADSNYLALTLGVLF
jgi:hypothetical protein